MVVPPYADIPILKSAADLEGIGERGHPQCNVKTSVSQHGMGVSFGFRNDSEGNPNGTMDKGGPHALQHLDSNSYCPLPEWNPQGWLPCPNNNYPLNPFEGSAGSILTSNFDESQFQTNKEGCSPLGENIEGAGLISFPIVAENGFQCNVVKEESKHHDDKTSLRPAYDELNPDGGRIVAMSKLQNGETGNCDFSFLCFRLKFKWSLSHIVDKRVFLFQIHHTFFHWRTLI